MKRMCSHVTMNLTVSYFGTFGSSQVMALTVWIAYVVACSISGWKGCAISVPNFQRVVEHLARFVHNWDGREVR